MRVLGERVDDIPAMRNGRIVSIHFTVIVMTGETTGGVCGMWFESASTSCSVCVPAVNSNAISV